MRCDEYERDGLICHTIQTNVQILLQVLTPEERILYRKNSRRKVALYREKKVKPSTEKST